jgi:hypothetical protein
MSTIAGPSRGEIEAMLPWYAVGTLNRRDAARVEAVLARDAELVRHYDVVREELAETIRLNESLGAPRARAGERLFAAIAVEGSRVSTRGSALLRWHRVGTWLSGLSPRVLSWSATVATLALVLQAGLLAGLGDGRYTSQSVKDTLSAGDAYAFVAFAPQASFADITKFLRAHKAYVVDGPRADGIYTIRVKASALSQEEVAEAVQELRQPNDVVRFIGLSR